CAIHALVLRLTWAEGESPRTGPLSLYLLNLTHRGQRVEIHKLRQGENLILGFSIGGGIDQDPTQNPFSEDKTDKGIYVTRVTEGGPAEVAGLQVGDKIMQRTLPSCGQILECSRRGKYRPRINQHCHRVAKV
uniref:Tax1-binding protein 3 n=1 Tax=Salvator merianae TaxID=96440 RepID=A0A8D0C4W4_SALMN